MKCKNCGHELRKQRIKVRLPAKQNWVWKHKFGGTHCKCEPFIGLCERCLCEDPVPLKEEK